MPRLTDITIRKARPTATDRTPADGGCLFPCAASGSKGGSCGLSNGTRRVHTLGTWPELSIKEAPPKPRALSRWSAALHASAWPRRSSNTWTCGSDLDTSA
jgi:hypothetical protein